MEGNIVALGQAIGAGLACIGMGGAAIGVGNVFAAYLSGALRNFPIRPAAWLLWLLGLVLCAAMFVVVQDPIRSMDI